MKKRNIAAILMMTLVLATGCGAKPSDTTATTAPSVQTDTSQTASKEAEGETAVITGTIEEIKDFMFTIVDDKGDAYSMSFDIAPEGLSEVKDGDQVTVTYTGELSVVDAFTGTVVSVQKAD